jgi:hypothetical protein
LLDSHGARITGTDECLLAGHQIADLLRNHCDQVSEEPFEVHPDSLWNVGRIMTVAYSLSALLLFVAVIFL